MPNGTIFNTPNTTTAIYVYAVNGDRIICTQEDSFDIIVSATPVITPIVFPAERCGTYVLPTLPTGSGYTIGYFTTPNGVGPITNLNILFPHANTSY